MDLLSLWDGGKGGEPMQRASAPVIPTGQALLLHAGYPSGANDTGQCDRCHRKRIVIRCGAALAPRAACLASSKPSASDHASPYKAEGKTFPLARTLGHRGSGATTRRARRSGCHGYRSQCGHPLHWKPSMTLLRSLLIRAFSGTG